MPSPIQEHGGRRFYRRKDGAYILQRGAYKKVGKNAYAGYVHYSRRDLAKDRRRHAMRSVRLRRRYPHAYD